MHRLRSVHAFGRSENHEDAGLLGTCSAEGAAPEEIPRLRAERATATARTGDVWISELEPGAMYAFDVVDLRSIEVLEAQRVDVHLHAVGLELLVHVCWLVLEVQIVLEASAAATYDSEAQSLAGKTFGGGDFLNFFSSVMGDRDHFYKLIETARDERTSEYEFSATELFRKGKGCLRLVAPSSRRAVS